MFSERGQVEAPFELLVAVIIMGFVITVGLYSMGYLNAEKCKSEVDFGLEKFKQELEVVVSNPLTSRVVYFNLPDGCFPEKGREVRIKEWDDVEICASFCRTAISPCVLMDYYAPPAGGNAGYGTRVCIYMPSSTSFPAESGGRCDSMEKYELTDLGTGIPEGTYLLVNKSGGTDTFPTVCAYRKLTA